MLIWRSGYHFLRTSALDQESTNFYKWPDSKYSRLCGSYSLCYRYSTLWLRAAVDHCKWMNVTVLMGIEIWISYNFTCYKILFFLFLFCPFINVKFIFRLWTVQKHRQQARFGLRAVVCQPLTCNCDMLGNFQTIVLIIKVMHENG